MAHRAGGRGGDVRSATGVPSALTGGPGNDSVYGSPADDTIDGGQGTDFCDGEGGTDTIIRCELP